MQQFGRAPYLECSLRGDRRFSALFARVKSRGGRTIEEVYQAAKIFEDGRTNLPWREAKGRSPVNYAYCWELYSLLWDEYISENPDLVDALLEATGLSDIFGQPGSVCQAEELWRIRSTFVEAMSA